MERKKREAVARGGLEPEGVKPSLEDELEEATELLSHQEPPAPAIPEPRSEDTDPLMIDPAD
jgi:hypothetical protein